MNVQPEILDVLSSAFRTGHGIGYHDGMLLGIWIGIAVASVLNALTKSAVLLWQWRLERKKQALLVETRNQFDLFQQEIDNSKGKS